MFFYLNDDPIILRAASALLKSGEYTMVQIEGDRAGSRWVSSDSLIPSEEKAMDVMVDRIDHLLRTGQYSRLNERIAITACRFPEDYTTNILLTLLTALLPAKSKLSNWERLLKSIRTDFLRRDLNADELLKGF